MSEDGWWDSVKDSYDSGKEFVDDVEDTARDAAQDAVDKAVPDGIQELTSDQVDNLQELAGLGSDQVSNLVSFAVDPADFILGIVFSTIVGWILTGAAVFIEAIQTALSPLVDVPSTIASPLMSAGETVVEAMSSVIGTVDSAIVTASMAAGPAAPMVVVMAWGIIAVMAIAAAREGIKQLPKVVPWL